MKKVLEFLSTWFSTWFGASASRMNADSRYVTLYVKPKACREVIEMRIDRANELSLRDDGMYYVRKLGRGQRCPFPVEIELVFSAKRELLEKTIHNGEEVTREMFEAFLSEKKAE